MSRETESCDNCGVDTTNEPLRLCDDCNEPAPSDPTLKEALAEALDWMQRTESPPDLMAKIRAALAEASK